MRFFHVVVAVLALASMAGCSKELWGLPRTAMSSTSPDGRWLAFVHPRETMAVVDLAARQARLYPGRIF